MRAFRKHRNQARAAGLLQRGRDFRGPHAHDLDHNVLVKPAWRWRYKIGQKLSYFISL